MSAITRRSAKQQAGVMLLEALIGILVFTIGIIGLMGMQAMATRSTADMKFRTEAALYAEQLINQMWADDHAALVTNYASPGGPKYQAWKAEIAAPGTGLPGATGANVPTVTIVQGGAGVAPTATTVTITIKWQGPSDATAHKYLTTTQLPPV